MPEPVAKGEPAGSYPHGWAIYRWIEGAPYADDLVSDEDEAAAALARFVLELRAIDSAETAPRGGRKPLRELDAITREAIEAGRGVIDSDAASAALGARARGAAPRGRARVDPHRPAAAEPARRRRSPPRGRRLRRRGAG